MNLARLRGIHTRSNSVVTSLARDDDARTLADSDLCRDLCQSLQGHRQVDVS